ncbi:hypothetical protein BJ878DRAFT_243157 [Calycina marina]|uniref:Uncharacterized protein n=1 Tax=Calycina marina TaxID=1763456 RepID=A0A9P7YWV8_9HELO|nr:hypothetical protein BJ878DRAFT_243157 [Calycina marina]
MDDLKSVIHTTPIIDIHSKPLLRTEALTKHDLLVITTEANGDAIDKIRSIPANIRAVKQSSSFLDYPATWEDVTAAIERENTKSNAWAKRCFEGIDVLLMEGGLDGKDETYDLVWHDRLNRHKSKQTVRIEKVAEEIIDGCTQRDIPTNLVFKTFMTEFRKPKEAIYNPRVVGFKSVIC